MITPKTDHEDMDAAADEVSRVFGIAGYSRAAVADTDGQPILRVAEEYLGEQLDEIDTFKVESKRADKTFPLKSPELSRELGGYL